MKETFRYSRGLKSKFVYLLIFFFLVLLFQALTSLCESLREEIRASLEIERGLRERNSQYKIEITSLTRERLLILTAMEKLNLKRASDEETYVIIK